MAQKKKKKKVQGTSERFRIFVDYENAPDCLDLVERYEIDQVWIFVGRQQKKIPPRGRAADAAVGPCRALGGPGRGGEERPGFHPGHARGHPPHPGRGDGRVRDLQCRPRIRSAARRAGKGRPQGGPGQSRACRGTPEETVAKGPRRKRQERHRAPRHRPPRHRQHPRTRRRGPPGRRQTLRSRRPRPARRVQLDLRAGARTIGWTPT